ncbi:ABC transporter permease subunit [Cohnella laeviribosi]|uniref:ABC transporter permease subunit n=1 Tax=Cohnella laeviribosi TaxID=380174 RepID=UPI00035D33DB
MMRKASAALPAGTFILLIAALWEAGTMLLGIPHYIIPKLSDVFVSMWDNRQTLAGHFAVTLGEALLGLGLSVALGTLAAVWIEGSRLARKTLYPLIVASQTIPIIALSPIMVLWFGYEVWSKVAVVILFTFFPIAVNTADGFRSADPEIGDLMRAMGARKRDLFLKWKLPSALPGFFTGLKMAATISVGGATLGEWLGGESGLGMYTKRASNMLRAEAVFSGVLLLSLMGILLFLAARLAERAVLSGRFPGEQGR